MWPGFDSRLMHLSFPMWLALLSNFDGTGIRTPARRAQFSHSDTSCLRSSRFVHQNVVLRNCASLFISVLCIFIETSVSLDLLCFELSFVLSPPSLWSAHLSAITRFALWIPPVTPSLCRISLHVSLGVFKVVWAPRNSRWNPEISARLTHKRKSCNSLLCNILGCSLHDMDTLAEWSRRRPAKPMGSPRVGSNPTGVDFLLSMLAGMSVRRQEDRQRGLEALRSFRVHALKCFLSYALPSLFLILLSLWIKCVVSGHDVTLKTLLELCFVDSLILLNETSFVSLFPNTTTQPNQHSSFQTTMTVQRVFRLGAGVFDSLQQRWSF